MPVISMFFGIVIRMYYEDHAPAHFHAEYRGEQASFCLTGEILSGGIRSRVARRLILDWAARHSDELTMNWARSRAGLPLAPIEPLE